MEIKKLNILALLFRFQIARLGKINNEYIRDLCQAFIALQDFSAIKKHIESLEHSPFFTASVVSFCLQVPAILLCELNAKLSLERCYIAYRMPQQMVLPVATEGCDYTWTLQELQLKQKNKINESLNSPSPSSPQPSPFPPPPPTIFTLHKEKVGRVEKNY